MSTLLHIEGAIKRYPGVVALDGVSLELHAGEILALVGENGAGKSTLINILAGAIQPDEGAIFLDGKRIRLDTPSRAHRHGIGVIHQDLRLVPELNTAENILLGREPVGGPLRLIDRKVMRRSAEEALRQVDRTLSPDVTVSRLSHAQQQLVAIARTLSGRPRILALDEPTAALSAQEADTLFALLRRLKSTGTGIIYITHRLDEVFALADRIVVLRDGRLAGSAPASAMDRRELIALMVGREIGSEYPQLQSHAGEEVLRLDRLSGPGVHEVSLSVHAGEILGLAGLVGAGRSELARLMFGAAPVLSGTMTLTGRPFAPSSPADAITAGIGLLTEDRNRLGLILDMNIRENMTLPNLRRFLKHSWIDGGRERRAAEELSTRMRLKTPSIERSISSLSGGNRQKVVLARWLMSDARLLIFDEPTTGIDVGARREIYDLMQELADRGLAVLVISSDLPELLGICNRIAVMSEGMLTGTLGRSDATQESVMELAMPRGGSR